VHPDDEMSVAPRPVDLVERALRAAARVPAGCDGLLFAPWLLGSIAPSPDDHVRGAFVGLSLGHERRHLVRAVLEGVALNLAWLLPHVEAMVGGKFPVLRFGGGGAQSELWAGALADATDRPVERLDAPRATNAKGAALLALDELGIVPLERSPELLTVGSRHEPDPGNRSVMDDALARLVALHPPLAQHR
jgi:sugar (pentulose or hexulose) kinase